MKQQKPTKETQTQRTNNSSNKKPVSFALGDRARIVPQSRSKK